MRAVVRTELHCCTATRRHRRTGTIYISDSLSAAIFIHTSCVETGLPCMMVHRRAAITSLHERPHSVSPCQPRLLGFYRVTQKSGVGPVSCAGSSHYQLHHSWMHNLFSRHHSQFAYHGSLTSFYCIHVAGRAKQVCLGLQPLHGLPPPSVPSLITDNGLRLYILSKAPHNAIQSH